MKNIHVNIAFAVLSLGLVFFNNRYYNVMNATTDKPPVVSTEDGEVKDDTEIKDDVKIIPIEGESLTIPAQMNLSRQDQTGMYYNDGDIEINVLHEKGSLDAEKFGLKTQDTMYINGEKFLTSNRISNVSKKGDWIIFTNQAENDTERIQAFNNETKLRREIPRNMDNSLESLITSMYVVDDMLYYTNQDDAFIYEYDLKENTYEKYKYKNTDNPNGFSRLIYTDGDDFYISAENGIYHLNINDKESTLLKEINTSINYKFKYIDGDIHTSQGSKIINLNTGKAYSSYRDGGIIDFDIHDGVMFILSPSGLYNTETKEVDNLSEIGLSNISNISSTKDGLRIISRTDKDTFNYNPRMQ